MRMLDYKEDTCSKELFSERLHSFGKEPGPRLEFTVSSRR